MADCTRVEISGVSSSPRFRKRETVALDTPAFSATSAIVTRGPNVAGKGGGRDLALIVLKPVSAGS